MKKNLNVLILEDNEDDALLLVMELRNSGYEPDYEVVCNAEAMENALGRKQWDIIISDYMMPGFSGLEALEVLNRKGVDLPFLLLSGTILEDTAISAMRRGARDCIMKDNIGRLAPAVDRELQETQNRIERRRAESKAEHLQSLLKNIVDSMPSILLAVDKDLKITQWNKHAEKETGISLENAFGKPFEEMFPRLAFMSERIEIAFKDKKPYYEFKVCTNIDDKVRYENITVYPLSSGNNEQGAVIRVDDVTENVRIEEMVIQSEKMISVGELAAGMAHEMNNPLAGIMQNSQVILDRIKLGQDKNEQVARDCGIELSSLGEYLEKRKIIQFIESIIESSKRASSIVTNMLSFCRKSSSQFAPFDLSELVNKAIELALNDYDLRKRYDFKQIEIVRDYQKDLPEIKCDGIKMQQVIFNLLKNSAQAMSEMVERSEPSRIILRLSRKDNFIGIELEDNGPGIPENIKKRIFEPFFTTKETGKGTGLGLSVSYFIITEDHHGTMELESAPGTGAKFTITIPLSQ